MLLNIQADPLVWVPGGCKSLFTRPPAFPLRRGSTEAQVSASVYGLVFRAKIGNPSTKLVLLALADNSNDSGYCFPGVKHLMEKCELGKRQILRHLDKLESDKLIKRESGGLGKGDRSEFWINLESVESRVSQKTPKARKGVVEDALRVSSVSDPPITPNKEEPSLEPSPAESTNLHSRVRAFIQNLHEKHFSFKCQWDASEAKILKSLLEANPSWKESDYERMIRNRFKSDKITSARPRTWLNDLSRYWQSPLDEWGKPKIIPEAKPNYSPPPPPKFKSGPLFSVDVTNLPRA